MSRKVKGIYLEIDEELHEQVQAYLIRANHDVAPLKYTFKALVEESLRDKLKRVKPKKKAA